MDLSYFDDYSKEVEENIDLINLAKNIGAFNWQYKPEFENINNRDDSGINHGIIAQDLLRVHELKDMVELDENGILKVKTDLVAMAALAYIAELTRKVLGVKYESNSNEMETATDTSTDAAADAADTTAND